MSLKDTSALLPHTFPECASLYLISSLSPNSFPPSPAMSSFSLSHDVSSPPSGHTKLTPTLPPTNRITELQTSPFHVFYTWLPLASAGTNGRLRRLSLEGRVESLWGRGMINCTHLSLPALLMQGRQGSSSWGTQRQTQLVSMLSHHLLEVIPASVSQDCPLCPHPT